VDAQRWYALSNSKNLIMTKINLLWFKKNIQSILNVGLVLLAIYLLFNACEKDADLQIAKNDLKNTEQKSKEKLNALADQNLAKQLIIDNTEKKVTSLEKENADLRLTKNVKSNIVKTQIVKAKSFKNDEIANYFASRYELPSDVLKVENGIQLTDTISKLAIVDLIGGDGSLVQLELTEKELFNTQKIVSFKDEIITQHQEKEVNFNLMLAEKDTIIEANKDYSSILMKSLRKEKRTKNLYKVTTVLAIVGGGYLLLK